MNSCLLRIQRLTVIPQALGMNDALLGRLPAYQLLGREFTNCDLPFRRPILRRI